MERYLRLCEILFGDKTDQVQFLEKLIEVLFLPGEVQEKEEASYGKGIMYVICWVLMPQTTVPVPEEFKTVNGLLKSDTSCLVGKFFSSFQDTYKNLASIIRNDTLISVSLTVHPYNQELLSVLSAEDCIPSLLWLLTYSREHQKLSSQWLPAAISKPSGVETLIQTISKGDNTFKLKDLCIKILKTTPVHNKDTYLQSVVGQMIQIISDYAYDEYVQKIIEQVLNYFLIKFPQKVLNLIESYEESFDLEGFVKFFGTMVQFMPPSQLILYRISQGFEIYMNLYEFLCRTPLKLKSELEALLVQFFGYWKESIGDLMEYIELNVYKHSFKIMDNGRLSMESVDEEVRSIQKYDNIGLLIGYLSSSRIGIQFCSDLFSNLLYRYDSHSQFWVIYFINYMLSTIEPVFLVNLPSQVQDFLYTALTSDDPKLNAISLEILAHSIPGNYENAFLLKISPKVIQLSNTRAEETSKIAEKVNKLISSHFLSSPVLETHPNPSSTPNLTQILSDLSSPEAYICAISLHKLSLSLKSLKAIPWSYLHEQLNKETYVFDKLLKCYVVSLNLKPLQGLEELFIQFETNEIIAQSRILEILFHWIKQTQCFEPFLDKNMKFLMRVVRDYSDTMIVNGAVVVISQIIKKIKFGSYSYLPDIISFSVSVIKASNSSLVCGTRISESTASALLLLYKIVKHSYYKHYEIYMAEILDAINIFDSYYKLQDNTKTLLSNLKALINCA